MNLHSSLSKSELSLNKKIYIKCFIFRFPLSVIYKSGYRHPHRVNILVLKLIGRPD